MGVGQKKPWLGAYNPLHLSACCVTLGKSLSLSKMLVASKMGTDSCCDLPLLALTPTPVSRPES